MLVDDFAAILLDDVSIDTSPSVRIFVDHQRQMDPRGCICARRSIARIDGGTKSSLRMMLASASGKARSTARRSEACGNGFLALGLAGSPTRRSYGHGTPAGRGCARLPSDSVPRRLVCRRTSRECAALSNRAHHIVRPERDVALTATMGGAMDHDHRRWRPFHAGRGYCATWCGAMAENRPAWRRRIEHEPCKSSRGPIPLSAEQVRMAGSASSRRSRRRRRSHGKSRKPGDPGAKLGIPDPYADRDPLCGSARY